MTEAAAKDGKPIRPRALTVVLPPELYVWLETRQADLRETQGIKISLSEVVRSELTKCKDADDAENKTEPKGPRR